MRGLLLLRLWLWLLFYATQFCCGYTFAYPRLGEVIRSWWLVVLLRLWPWLRLSLQFYNIQFCCGYTFAYPCLEEGVIVTVTVTVTATATVTVTTILRYTILLRVYFWLPVSVWQQDFVKFFILLFRRTLKLKQLPPSHCTLHFP